MTHYLEALVKKGGVGNVADRENEEAESKTSGFIQSLGYYALIGLLRVNCLLSDYVGALKVLDTIDLGGKRSFFTRVPTCHASLYYHLGLAYLMTRRYMDAIKTLSAFLVFIGRKHNLTRAQQLQLTAVMERMYGLLAIAVSLCPQPLDDAVAADMREKLPERLPNMQKGDVNAFEATFREAAPRFILPSLPDLDGARIDPAAQQLRVLIGEVKQRAGLTELVSQLKLCSSIGADKLGALLAVNDDGIRTMLMCLKHKTRNLRWKGGPPSRGEWVITSEIDFNIAKDMVYVTQHSSARRYGDYFIRNILKLEDMIQDAKESLRDQSRD